jgi:phosphatidylglycerol---prolipoprotein diacylglyceryl transferase
VSFPVELSLGPWRVHPHVLFELLAYATGFRLYLATRRRQGDAIDDPRRWWVVAAAALGAALGARVVFLLECPAETLAHLADAAFLLSGKTIVGGLAGGWLAVEAAKKLLGIAGRTGDLFAIPLAAAIAIGRVGCFLTGLPDHTCGVATALPWGIDFGDGVRRHPTQLYEIVFLLLLIVALARIRRRGVREGDLFRGFAAGYFAFRLAVDFWKPAACRGLGLSAIQWVCLGALAVCGPDIFRWLRGPAGGNERDGMVQGPR